MNHCPLGPRKCRACKNARYGAEHQRRRKLWTGIVLAGNATCSRCGQRIAPDAAWHLDHHDATSSPAHQSCNCSASVTTRRGRGLQRGSAGY